MWKDGRKEGGKEGGREEGREGGVEQTDENAYLLHTSHAPTGSTTFNRTHTLMDLIILQKKTLQATDIVGALCKYEGA